MRLATVNIRHFIRYFHNIHTFFVLFISPKKMSELPYIPHFYSGRIRPLLYHLTFGGSP